MKLVRKAWQCLNHLILGYMISTLWDIMISHRIYLYFSVLSFKCSSRPFINYWSVWPNSSNRLMPGSLISIWNLTQMCIFWKSSTTGPCGSKVRSNLKSITPVLWKSFKIKSLHSVIIELGLRGDKVSRSSMENRSNERPWIFSCFVMRSRRIW